MDNHDLIQKFMESAYHDGNRAYMQDGNHVVYVPYAASDEPKFWSLKQIQWDIQRWHALRAYQDAERKKGTPIDPKDLTGKDWVYRDYYGFAFNIEVRVGHPQKLKIYVYDHENNGNFPVAKFTNFRWRAGYPKEKTAIQLAREAVDKPGVHWPGCPKGGQHV